MADEHSFDIVSKVDMQEVLNSVQQATKEMSQRFDFKASKSSIEFNKDNAEITLISDDEQKMKSVVDILQSKFAKRGVSLKSLVYGKLSRQQEEQRGRSLLSSRGLCRKRQRRL